MATTACGYEAMRSGDVTLFYINRDGLPLSDRCNDRMWTFCMEQYPKSEFIYDRLFVNIQYHIKQISFEKKVFVRKRFLLFLHKHH